MQHFHTFQRWLLDAHPRITNPEKIQQSRLLSAMLLALILVGSIILLIVIQHDPEDIHEPEVKGALFLLGITVAMYILNRLGYNRYAAAGIIFPFGIVFTYIAFSSSGKAIFLAFLLIPILLTAIFFSLRWTTIISVLFLSAILILLSFQDQVSETSPFWTLRSMWFFLLLATGLVLTFMWHLSDLEEIRKRELIWINQELEKDIQLRTQAENAHRQSEARLRALVENSPDFILELDRSGNILFINRFVDRYLGKNIRELLPSNQLERALEELEKAFESGAPQSLEIETASPSGRISWDSVRIGPVKQGDQVRSVTVIMTEITSKKLAEMALRESEARYRKAISAAGLVPYEIDYQREQFTYIGAGIFELTGCTAEEIQPSYFKENIQEEYIWGPNAGFTPREARARFRAGTLREWRSDMRILNCNGESRWLSDGSIIVVDEEGNVRGAIGIFQDITARKEAEIEHEELIAELENRNAELERFTYSVSHELKSPMVTIKGFLGSIDQDMRTKNFERAQRDLNRISLAADKMLETLSGLLELSRIGRVIHPPEMVSLVELAHSALQTLDARIRSKSVRVHISDDLPHIWGDRSRLGEVFENLIDNAVKYMGNQFSPMIEIGVRTDDKTVIFVKDNGIGIEPAFQDKIFGLFEKLNPAAEGTGIGLALVKRIVETHGGRIWVESEGTGKGSTFCFTLPLAAGSVT